MDPITRQAIAAAGAGGSDPLYADDVFSIDLYRNDSTTEEFNNGLDMAGEGGLIVTTFRDLGTNRAFVDSERGVTKVVYGDSSNQESTAAWIQSFDDDGFTHGSYIGTGNNSGVVSWSFRKCPGFFDVVTYTGNGTSGRTVSHNLGSVPGMIIVKNLHDTGYSWAVWHKSLGTNGYLFLNSDNQKNTNSVYFPSQPTASNFIVGTSGLVNINNDNYVAYVFADDDASFGTDTDEAIIKCGSYTGTGSSGNAVNLGFEPQWVLIKQTNTNRNWVLVDNMRGVPSGGSTAYFNFNTDLSEDTGAGNIIDFTATGFELKNHSALVNGSSGTYIYMAIRRPHKPPTAGTQVFTAAYSRTPQSSQPPAFDSNNHVVDFGMYRRPATTENWYVTNRLTAPKYMNTNSTASESSSAIYYDYQHGFGSGASTDYFAYMFRRAPGFMDVVAYTGTGSAMTINHNLGATPELLIVKRRSSSGTWWTYSSVMGNNAFMRLEGTFASDSPANLWNNTTPSSTTFSLGNNSNVVSSGVHHIAFLFASLSGISKVGSYSGNSGYDVNVDCGFTAGARFILIKRTDSTSDWYVWDSTRGIVSGNDPYWFLNSTAVQVTNTDYIDPLNAGFTVTSSAPAALNTSGGTYLFLAIA
tara:strand:- start:79 stop:1992 length:1914 start_codon:yes stop_codon:yes gene_type:complete